jgi:hypothetical protein
MWQMVTIETEISASVGGLAVDIVLYCIVLYCIVLYLFSVQTSMKRIQNIMNIQLTDNNKYIKFKVLNIIIKIKLKI